MMLKINAENLSPDRPVSCDSEALGIKRDFFDRDKCRSNIVAFLANPEKCILWFIGERRSGKTTLLRNLEFRCSSEQEGSPIYIGIADSECSFQKSTEEFLKLLDFKFLKTSERTGPTLITLDAVVEQLNYLLGALPERPVVLAIDEIDIAYSWNFSPEEQSRFRLWLWNLCEAFRTGRLQRQLHLIFTCVMIPNDLYFPDMSKDFRVPPFAPQDLDQLLDSFFGETAGEITTDDRRRCHQLTGNWPYYLHWLCAAAHELEIELEPGWPDRTIDRVFYGSDLEAVTIYNSFDSIQQTNFANWILKQEGQILLRIASQERLSHAEAALLGPTLQEMLPRLIKRGYVEEHEQASPEDSPEGYVIPIGILQAWLQRRRQEGYDLRFESTAFSRIGR